MPILRVEMFKGRTREQKRLLVRELPDAFVRVCGGKPDAVTIVLVDVDNENWAGSGELMADKYPD